MKKENHTLISFKTYAVYLYRAMEDYVDCAIVENNTNHFWVFSSRIIAILMAADDFDFLKKALITVSCSNQRSSQTFSVLSRQTFLSTERQLK